MSRKSAADRFLDLVTLKYAGAGEIGPPLFAKAAELLEKKPDLPSRSMHVAAAAGDVEALKVWVKEKPKQLDKPGGPFNWTPLMYAAYARLPGISTLDAGLWLLEQGADPNFHHLYFDQYIFTVLTGVFGQGEGGPVNLPEHPEMRVFARALLEHGANPNDSQAAYNRCFLPDNTCFELLLEFGLTTEDRNDWKIEEDRVLVPHLDETMHFHLAHAVRRGFFERVRLLVNHGAEVSRLDNTYDTRVKERTLYESALLTGHTEIAGFLLQKGARRSKLSGLDQFEAACMAGHLNVAERLLRANPEFAEEVKPHQREMLCDAASNGSRAGLETMIALGFDLSEPGGRSPLHEAAWNGHIEIARLLVDAGADPSMPEPVHSASPLGFAEYARQTKMTEYLRRFEGE